jgi:hypothetical protein
MSRYLRIAGLLVFMLLIVGLLAAVALGNTLEPALYLPLMVGGSGEVPPVYTIECDQDFKINIVNDEIHFDFSATAFADGNPLSDVELKGTVDTGGQQPFNVEQTNLNGVADFQITALTASVTKTPVATVTFADTETYGDASCTIDFSGHSVYEVVCAPGFDIRVVDEEVHFEFEALALKDGDPLSNVEMKGTLDTGDVQPFEVKETRVDGNVDFRITVLITQISQTPIATVTFFEPNIYGDASCTISAGVGSDIDWAAIMDRSNKSQ